MFRYCVLITIVLCFFRRWQKQFIASICRQHIYRYVWVLLCLWLWFVWGNYLLRDCVCCHIFSQLIVSLSSSDFIKCQQIVIEFLVDRGLLLTILNGAVMWQDPIVFGDAHEWLLDSMSRCGNTCCDKFININLYKCNKKYSCKNIAVRKLQFIAICAIDNLTASTLVRALTFILWLYSAFAGLVCRLGTKYF